MQVTLIEFMSPPHPTLLCIMVISIVIVMVIVITMGISIISRWFVLVLYFLAFLVLILYSYEGIL